MAPNAHRRGHNVSLSPSRLQALRSKLKGVTPDSIRPALESSMEEQERWNKESIQAVGRLYSFQQPTKSSAMERENVRHILLKWFF
ncbi:hypothetical protein BJX96DRAFT_157136 [Aspergillus floccosus]